ncbi:MAG: hypothetical protein WCI20_15925 [bacterium]
MASDSFEQTMKTRTMTVTCALAAATAISVLAADQKPLFGAADWLPSEIETRKVCQPRLFAPVS